MSRRLTLSLFASLLFLLPATSALAQRDPFSPEELAVVEQKFPDANKTITGIRYIIHQEGTGEPAHSGDQVSVLYRGMLMNGTVFNECLDRAKPFVFRLGRGQVIDGWDQALKLMNEGCKITLIIPYELAYGTRGNPPAVPRQANLIFEVEMVKIERATPPPAPPAADPKKKK